MAKNTRRWDAGAVTSFLFRRERARHFKVEGDAIDADWMIVIISCPTCPLIFGANMGEVIRFVSRSERERMRLIQEARAIYDSIFPPSDPASDGQDGDNGRTIGGDRSKLS
ncbi:hypothetical protein [Bradyrhizobium sp. BR 1432]|uniref:hypothetical protein n=1 Tax=Bradyrhizobium sp. BR 1432 TaxID=3447966 RepID=UPI003EE763CE